MKLLHEGYLFFQSKENLVVHFPFLTVYWKFCLIYPDTNYSIEYHQLYRRGFSFCSFSITINDFYSFLSSSLVFLFAFVIFFYLVDSVYFKEMTVSFSTYTARKLKVKIVLPLYYLMVCISRSSFTSGTSYFAYLDF